MRNRGETRVVGRETGRCVGKIKAKEAADAASLAGIYSNRPVVRRNSVS